MAATMRLQRYLASAGVAARRKAETLITEGRVKVNGKVVTTLGSKVDPERDHVQVDDEAVMALDAFYVLLNKPKACITAVTDDRGRPTVMDYLKNLPVPVKPVGRLDFYSEGVLLLTNDGELAAKLLAPGSHVPKTYHVKVHGQLDKDHLKALREGVTLDDGTTTMPAEISVLPGESKYTWLAITIHEGKHRQIHRMVESLGYRVDKLQRVAFANLTFHNLRVGDARELSQTELNTLRDAVGLDHSKVARGRWHSDREETDIPRRARAKARDEAEAEAAENEARRLANIARRAAAGGDAWDGEGDPDRDVEGDDLIKHTGLDMEDRDAAGASADDDDDDAPMHHMGLDMEARDAAGGASARGGGPRGGGSRGGPRGGAESARGGSRGG
ncbi:MAG: pseudouridine synthase, partial [Myxococcales bacterium]|nr:pseudouridine synthase [Myxococcales bacterium]